MIYGAGFLAVMLIFALLYRHAHARRAELELNALEVFDTRSEIALLAGAGLAGFVYFLVGVVEAVHGNVTGKRLRELQARLADEVPAGVSQRG